MSAEYAAGAATVDDMFQNPAATGFAGVLGTAVLAWLGQRLVGKAAIQTAINASFKEVMDQLRQELRVAIQERDAARAQAAERQAQIEELRATISALELRVAAAPLPRAT